MIINMKTKMILAIIASGLLIACTPQGKKFNVKKNEKDGKITLSYHPKVNLEKIKDSATFYHTTEDYAHAYQSELQKGDIISSTSTYNLRVMARDYFTFNKVNYEFLLRTFTIDGKIIDTFSFAYILDDKLCEASFDGNNTIERTCNGKKEVFTITDEGKFIPKS